MHCVKIPDQVSHDIIQISRAPTVHVMRATLLARQQRQLPVDARDGKSGKVVAFLLLSSQTDDPRARLDPLRHHPCGLHPANVRNVPSVLALCHSTNSLARARTVGLFLSVPPGVAARSLYPMVRNGQWTFLPLYLLARHHC